jgi:hypothetical protein
MMRSYGRQSTMIYTSRTGAAGMLLDIKLYNGKFEIVSFVVKFRLNGIAVTDDRLYVPFVVVTIPPFFPLL